MTFLPFFLILEGSGFTHARLGLDNHQPTATPIKLGALADFFADQLPIVLVAGAAALNHPSMLVNPKIYNITMDELVYLC